MEEEQNLEEKKLWHHKYSNSTYADWWLGFFTFIEASFFPLPPVTLMTAIMLSNGRHNRWVYYGTLTAVTSVLGGLFGYLIGFVFYDVFGDVIIGAYNLHTQVDKVNLMFQNNAFLAVFVAAFTPIPYKVFTISAGFFNVNIFVFAIASLLGRGLRYYFLAALVGALGNKISDRVKVYINHSILIIAIVVVLYFMYKVLTFFLF